MSIATNAKTYWGVLTNSAVLSNSPVLSNTSHNHFYDHLSDIGRSDHLSDIGRSDHLSDIGRSYDLKSSEWLLMSFNYYLYDIWQIHADPRSSEWTLFTGGPWSTIGIIVGYLYFVKVFGPGLMKGREPLNLSNLIFIYNLIMTTLSLCMFVESCLVLNWGLDTWGCQLVDYNMVDDIEKRKLFLGWLFFMTKFIELSDTIFFVLRKKHNQASRLHIIHHSLVPILVWHGYKFLPGGSNSLFVYINSLIHTIMYSYYALSTFGPKIQPYLWWKKYLTKLQIIQFILIIINNIQILLMPNCQASKVFSYISIFNAGLFLLLFLSFYKQTYKKL